jgi:hypothetical protein
VNQISNSVVREIRTPRCVGVGTVNWWFLLPGPGTEMSWATHQLHLIINHKGEVIALKITKGNVDDRSQVEELTKDLTGVVYADKGYISSNLFLKLFNRGLKLVHGIRNNMKNKLMLLIDKILLKKRSLIESVFNILKNQMNLEHTRHRSPLNFLVNIISCLTAYCFKKNKKAVAKISKKMKVSSKIEGWLMA